MSKEIEERLKLYKKAAVFFRGGLGSKARGYLTGFYGENYSKKHEDKIYFEEGKRRGEKDKIIME